MGEIAEGIREGLLCQECGVFIAAAVPNQRRWCDDCRPKDVDHIMDLMGALKRSIERGGPDGEG